MEISEQSLVNIFVGLQLADFIQLCFFYHETFNKMLSYNMFPQLQNLLILDPHMPINVLNTFPKPSDRRTTLLQNAWSAHVSTHPD